MLDRISRFLQGFLIRGRRRIRPFDFPSLEFPPLDVDRTAEQLRVEENAVANGSREVPKSDATQLDGPQLQIIQFIKGEVADIRNGYVLALKGLNRRIDEVDIRHHTEVIRHLGEELNQDLWDLSTELKPEIRRAREDYQQAQDELRRFKLRNGLEREPQYPESRFLLWSIIVSVLVAEALVNAFFFQRGMILGYSGGAALAFVLAFVDVLVVFWLGRLIAWFISFRWVHRLVSIVATGVFAGWALLYNLLTAHIREQLHGQVPIEEASRIALQHFRASPFGLEQADSWVFFALGLVFSILAMVSGLNWDEKFPGYGAKHRRRNELREDYLFVRAELLRRGSELRDEKLARLDEMLRQAQEDLVLLRHTIETKDALLKTVTECIQHYRDSCRALIQRYRDHNHRARSTAPPEYFDEPINVALPPPLRDETTRDYEKLRSQESAYEEVMGLAASIRENLNSSYREFLDRESPVEPEIVSSATTTDRGS